MKNLITLLLLSSVSLNLLQAQKYKGIDKSPLDMIEFPSSNSETNKLIRVLYSRPQLNGRYITKLVPDGKLWRVGANEATELTLYVPMQVDGKNLDAGSYTLYAIPNLDKMTIIINKATHVWGSYSYNESLDVVRLDVPISENTESLEALSMAFEATDKGVNLYAGWETYRVMVAFTKS